MARARKKKAKPVRKRAPKRSKAADRSKAVTAQSQTNWQIGAGIFALAVILGLGAYMISTNETARSSVANFVERIEVPQSVKEFPENVKQNLPEMPSLTNSANTSKESAPAR